MLTTVRIRRKLFHHDVWRVLIDGHKWLYDKEHDSFIETDRNDWHAISTKDMPIAVRVGFLLAWENNKLILYERYSHRHSYAWKLLIGTLQREGRDIVVFSRGRRMGIVRYVDDTDNSLL